MTGDPPPADQFWLLTPAGPEGPLTAEQLRRALASGRATYGTKVCPAGGGEWLPLHRALGLTPATPPSTARQLPLDNACGSSAVSSPRNAADPAPPSEPHPVRSRC